jgi:hypothetical protein
MSLKIEFKSDDVGILKRFSFIRATSKWADAVGPEILSNIRREAPHRTGRLKDSLTYRKRLGLTGVALEFGSNVPYAGYVEEGTPPHIIQPRNASVLRFTMRGGETVYARSVNHPGTRANPYARRAVEQMLPFLELAFQEIIEEQFRGA